MLLASPFVTAAAILQSFVPSYGVSGALAALCAVFAASWLAAFCVAMRGSGREIEFATLVGGATLVGVLIAQSGGPGAPVALLAAALPFEAWWITRSRRVAAVAAAAGAGAVAFAAIATGAGATGAGAGWLWLSPLAYGASLAVRLLVQVEAQGRLSGPQAAGLPEDCFDAAVARLNHAGEVDAMSARAGGILGVEPSLLLGTGLFERIHVADRVAFLCAAAQTRAEGVSTRCALRIRMPVTAEGGGGGYRPFEVELVRPSAEAGVAAIIRDGQEKAELRAELARAVEQAGATEIAKGRFLAAVSHELRTPLNAIIGFSDMLLHRDISGDLAPKQSEHVELIREAGNHLLSVVNAILDVSKIEAGSYRITVEPFDLKPAVDLCCAMLAPQAADKGVTISAKLPSGLGEIAGDQRAVQQILINLLSNAVKFTPEGGTVSVTAAGKDGMVRIFVNDTGIGIGADDLARLGQPFMQVQNDYTRQFQGTGLGLSLVKGLVRLHGGTMSMESAPGLGTTVTIGLPTAGAGKQHETDATGEKEDGYGIALRKIA